MNEINTWTAWQMAEAINQGDVSAEEVTQSCLDRIAKREDAVKAWAFWVPELALKQAKACDEYRAAGNPRVASATAEGRLGISRAQSVQ